jgi:hypothetical protein
MKKRALLTLVILAIRMHAGRSTGPGGLGEHR